MNYFLIKLQFDSAVHFGGSDSALSLYTSEEFFRADTLFSALCHTALVLRGEAGLQALYHAAQQGTLLFSDAMPWQEETFYLPKPFLPSFSTEEVETSLRKKVKKLAWLPALRFDSYVRSLHQGHFVPDGVQESFGTHYEQTKAKVSAQGDTEPYQVGLFRFAPDCGLYFFCACREVEQMDDLTILLEALGLSGIGGKTTAGYGRFHIEDSILLNEPFDEQTAWLYQRLCSRPAPYLLLTSSLPQDAELDAALQDGSFQLIRRGGFLASEQVETPVKKRSQHFLAAGSVLHHTYQGAVYDVGIAVGHPVYRYAKPLFLGVTL